MRSIVAMKAGGPEVLAEVTGPEPSPGPGQILVEVLAAGVNFIDTYLRSGLYPMEYPSTLGREGAGHVIAVGEGVTAHGEGDLVAWFDQPGSYADRAVIEADHALGVPDGIGAGTAAAVALQGLTAHYLVTSSHPVAEGETVLVHAGAGGVGLLLTQMAVARGARVLATTSSDEKAELSRGAGADAVLRYDQYADISADLPREVRELTDGAGVNAVYDGVGRATFDGSLASLARRGSLVVFGGASGPVPPLDIQRLNRAGSVFLSRPTLGDFTADRNERAWRAEELFGAVADGSLDVRIGHRYLLAEAAEAHRALEGRATTGKVLLVP